MLARLIDNISESTGKMSAWCLLLIDFFITFEVAMRYVFNSSTVWVGSALLVLQGAVQLYRV